jgi:hypothetical protein
MPNLIPDWLPWMRPAGRLIWAVALLVIGLAIVAVLMRRRSPDAKCTWAEAMAGAVGVFALMTLAYAVIPHEWITFSDKYLRWDTTKFLVRSGQSVLGVNFPTDINMRAISDAIAAGIYVVAFGLNLFLFVAWQKRGQVAQASADELPKKSRFGRPLRRKVAQPAAATARAGGDA